MPPKRPLLVTIAALGALTACVPTRAQERTQPQRSVYRKLFPQPTGKNGYEELIAAGEAARSSRLYVRAEAARPNDVEGKSLSFKRRVLADPPVVKALALLQQGLAKPLMPLPRDEGPDAEARDASFQQSRMLRTLARLLGLRQYVLLADGRVSEAITVTRQGMHIARLLYTEPQITGLLGANLAMGALRPLAGRLDQLSAKDCEQLYQLCLEWLRLPDPQIWELTRERRRVPMGVAELRKQIAEGGVKALEKASLYEDPIPETVQAALSASPEALDRLFGQVAQRLDAVYAHEIAQFQRPPWERTWDAPNHDGSPAALLVELIHPAYGDSSGVADFYTRGSAYIQLFACHCALRRYRWEHDRYPATVAELNLGPLAIDPFTGQSFTYEVRGSTYRLASAGPRAAEDDAEAVSGRVPLTIVPGEE